MLLALKHGRDEVALRVRMLTPDGQAPVARDVLASVLRYILDTAGVKPATLRELLARQVDREEAQEMLTTAEMLRREGKVQGKVEGKREMLLLLLRQRFGRLPAASVARIKKAAADDLDVWSGRVLAASSLEDVLAVTVAAPASKGVQPTRARARPARRRARA